MALPPTIPTSFVPKQPVTTHARHQASGTNIFMLIAGVILLISVACAAATFGYGTYLSASRDSKNAELVAAQQAVNIDVVEDFIRLRNRLNSVEQLLDQHVELSEFFDVLELRTLQTVRFSELNVSVGDDRTAEIEMSGVARNFNALAAQSNELASEKRIKRAIFSGISVNDNGTVSFSLSAVIDPRLITSAEVLPGIGEAPTTEQAPVMAPAAVPTTPTAPAAPRATTTSPVTGTSTSL